MKNQGDGDAVGSGLEDQALRRGATTSLSQMMLTGGAWTLGGRIARTIIGLAGIAILARLLAPNDFGVVALIVTVLSLSLVVVEGFVDLPSIRHDDLSARGLSSLIWAALGIMGVFAATLWITAPTLEQLLEFPQLCLALRATSPILLMQVFIVAGFAILRRQHRFKAAATISVAQVAIYMVSAVILALVGFGLWSVLLSQVFAATLATIVVVRVSGLPCRPPSRVSFNGLSKTSTNGAISAFLAWGFSNIDTIAVAALLGPNVTGIYSRAYNLVVQFKEPFVALDQVTRQALAAAKGTPAAFDRLVFQLLTVMTTAGAIVATTAAAAAKDVVLLLLGSNFVSASPVLVVLLAGLPMRIALLVADSATINAGQMRLLPLRHGFMLIALAGALLQFARLGPVAVAAAVSTTVWLGAFLGLASYARGRGLPAWRPLLALVPALIAAASVWAALMMLFHTMPASALLGRLAASTTVLSLGNLLLFLFAPSHILPERLARLKGRLSIRFGKGA